MYTYTVIIVANVITWFFCSNSPTGLKDPSFNSDNTDYDIAGLMYVAASSTLCFTTLYSACLNLCTWHLYNCTWQLCDHNTKIIIIFAQVIWHMFIPQREEITKIWGCKFLCMTKCEFTLSYSKLTLKRWVSMKTLHGILHFASLLPTLYE